MSTNVFRYIIEADEEQLKEMQISIDCDLQSCWRERLRDDSKVKPDDVGDALLHALDKVLCGSTNFKQLVPAVPPIHVNRTIGIVVFPSTTYWVVLQSNWNTFVFENFGWFDSQLEGRFYKDESTVSRIVRNINRQTDLTTALSNVDGDNIYGKVSHIKVAVKQLTGHTDLALWNKDAGALTDSTVKAMKRICGNDMGPNSQLSGRRDNILGNRYVRILKELEQKHQLVSSTGKHTNAVLSCLEWMKQNLADYVKQRREFLNETEKRVYFDALLQLADSEVNRIEMLEMSEEVKSKMISSAVSDVIQEGEFKRNIADLVLISISKNQQHVKANAANSRKYLPSTTRSVNNQQQTRQSRKRTVRECNTDAANDIVFSVKKARTRSRCNGRECIKEPEGNLFSDCTGNMYRQVRMRGNGFCGFNSLAYCLTGDQQSYEEIIDDCINVFLNVPDLFRIRTNF